MLLFFQGYNDVENIISILEGENSYRYDIYKILSSYFLNRIFNVLLVNSVDEFDFFFKSSCRIYLDKVYIIIMNYIFELYNKPNEYKKYYYKSFLEIDNIILFISNRILNSLFSIVYYYNTVS